MATLQGKKILLGLTGGIAAYKAPELVRRLKEHGAIVRVVMTTSAQAFVTPLSLQAVSGFAVADSLLDTEAELAMGHIELAKWADMILIAPATANTIAKLTHGFADNLLTTLCLASAAPLVIAPAMNQQMWHAPATQHNIELLSQRGLTLWGPEAGEQACGDVGYGRMLDVPELVTHCLAFFNGKSHIEDNRLTDQHWVITAGPTREAIDPVRYISNHSSGKMGYAIAEAAQQLGAKVTIISGPVNIKAPANCALINVNSAVEMHQQALDLATNASVFVGCAAVADYRVAEVAEHKIKKTADNDDMSIALVKNPDIIADVAAIPNKPFMIGFAAETQDVAQYAQRKLVKKNLDMIAANDVAQAGQGFNSDKNALTVFDHQSQTDLPLSTKTQLAMNLVTLIADKYQTLNIKK